MIFACPKDIVIFSIYTLVVREYKYLSLEIYEYFLYGFGYKQMSTHQQTLQGHLKRLRVSIYILQSAIHIYYIYLFVV